jgi:NAD(P)-dependent dehydrogenase (short-subunit alcohol dehydrogenase family)
MKSCIPAALVTGGARRIGREIALDLAAAGMDIALHCRESADAAEETAEEVRALGREVRGLASRSGRSRRGGRLTRSGRRGPGRAGPGRQ